MHRIFCSAEATVQMGLPQDPARPKRDSQVDVGGNPRDGLAIQEQVRFIGSETYNAAL